MADASLIARSQITDDARLRMGPESFACVIVPSARTIDPAAAVRLDAFAEAGGCLLFVGRIPERCYPEADAAAKATLLKWAQLNEKPKDVLSASGRGRVGVLSSTRNLSAVLRDAAIPSLLDFPAGRPSDILLAVRRTNDAALWLMVNEGAQRTFEVILPWAMVPGGKSPRPVVVHAVDPLTGEDTVLPAAAGRWGRSGGHRAGAVRVNNPDGLTQ